MQADRIGGYLKKIQQLQESQEQLDERNKTCQESGSQRIYHDFFVLKLLIADGGATFPFGHVKLTETKGTNSNHIQEIKQGEFAFRGATGTR